MNREKLYQHLEQHYVSKREMISRLPLDVQPDEIWQDVLNRRRVRSIMLPIHSPRGNPYWYVTTQKMASASDRIISEMMDNETEFDPYRNLPAATCLEESFFTSYVEGSQLTMQDAMAFIQGDMEPQSAEEQLIVYDAVDCYRMPYPGMLLSSEQNNYANRLFNVAMTRAKGKMVSLVNVEYMENKKLSGMLLFRQLMDLLSIQSLRSVQVLKEMDP